MQSQNEPSAMKVAIDICEEFAEHWEQQARSGDNTGASDHRADAARQIIAELRNVNTAPPAQIALTDAAIEAGWHQTFSTNNPYCPCNLKSFTKAVQWAERALTAAQSGVKS